MHLFDKQLNLSFRLLFIVCLSLLFIRFFNSISFFEPLHVQTGGAEDTSFIGIWFIKNGILKYDHFLNFKIDIDNPNIFSLFHYNWLFYYLNSLSITLSQKIFDLSDLWLPTIVRINCFVLSVLSFIIFHKSLNIISNNKFSFFFSFYLLLGPLTGYWVISGKPDIFYLFFELLGIYLILKTRFNHNFFNLFIILTLLYLSWSVKQTSIVTISALLFYLLWKRNIKYFLFVFTTFSGLLILTKILGPNKLFESIFWQDGAALSFNFGHFFRVFLDSVSKGLIVYTGLLCVFLNILLKKNFYNYFKSLSENQIFLLIGLFFSTSQIFFSFHYGSAVNYYYIFFIYGALFLFTEIEDLLSRKKINFLFISGVYVQIFLILLIFFGIKGSLKPIKYSNVKQFKNCVSSLKTPILSDHKPYYRLPWITPEDNPILVTMMYENYIKNLDFKETPVFKEITKGSFKSLIIANPEKYNLENYNYVKKCNSLYETKVNIYVNKN